MVISKTSDTIAAYIARAARLHDRYQSSRGLGDEGSAEEFVAWLLGRKPELTSTSWRTYRAAAIYFLEQAGEDDAAAVLRRDALAPACHSPRRSEVPARGSRLKAKRWLAADLDKVVTCLTFFSRSAHSLVLVDWLRAGVATGLRPCEWSGAALHGDDLVVVNAKATNGRANGVTRTMGIGSFAGEDRDAIARMCARGAAWASAGTYDTHQSACADILARTVARIWPGKSPGYSLYTCRHQAIANWKTTLPLPAVAALAGHCCTSTSASSYGKRRSGWKGAAAMAVPEIDDDQVERVRDNLRRRPAALGIRLPATPPLGNATHDVR